MAAEEGWDGKIEIEESIPLQKITTGNITAFGFTESVSREIQELVQRSYSDTISGKFVIGGFPEQIDMT